MRSGAKSVIPAPGDNSSIILSSATKSIPPMSAEKTAMSPSISLGGYNTKNHVFGVSFICNMKGHRNTVNCLAKDSGTNALWSGSKDNTIMVRVF